MQVDCRLMRRPAQRSPRLPYRHRLARHRSPFLCAPQVQAGVPLRACLAATTSADVWGVRRELLPWLQYHTELGVAHFYVSGHWEGSWS